MINLSFDKLILIAKNGNISDYENKSEEDLIKALSELETPKPETPKHEIRVNQNKLKKSEKILMN